MKKLVFNMIALMMLIMLSSVAYAENETETDLAANKIENVEGADQELLEQRLEYISDMDKSDLTSAEKKELRKEVKAIKKELNQPYIYISSGVLILILVLLLVL